MDKINRALSASEDNSVMISELRGQMKKLANSFDVRTGANGSLGEVSAPKGGAAMIVFDGGSVNVEFCGEVIASGASPIIASLPAGTGELKLSAARDGLRALVLCKI